jgi:flavodoxin
MPLYTFLEHYDLSGKTIVPFCTHEGSGYGSSLSDIAKLCPGAQIAPALEVKGCKIDENRERIVAWARENA